MPLVKSYFQLAEKYNNDYYPTELCTNNITRLVETLTKEILQNEPFLVADVTTGKGSRSLLESAITRLIENSRIKFGYNQDELNKRVFDYMFGYGPLQEFINNDEITDIDGTAYNQFTVKLNGIRETVNVEFTDEKSFDTFCRLIIIRNGGIINENDSHCRVTDEKLRLRINVSIPPRNLSGPSISIRKHRKKAYTYAELINLEMINENIVEVLEKFKNDESTIVFSGKGASGKTTLLRAFINSLSEMERVLIAESDSEIFPEKKNCITQRIKKSNEGGKPVTLKDLVSDGLTMSLDTYCVGEIVGNEAWEFLKAAYSGHRCLATTHSESAIESLDRLLTLAQPGTSGESERVIKKIIGYGIDGVVYMKNFKVLEIIKIEGFDNEKEDYKTTVLWKSGKN